MMKKLKQWWNKPSQRQLLEQLVIINLEVLTIVRAMGSVNPALKDEIDRLKAKSDSLKEAVRQNT